MNIITVIKKDGTKEPWDVNKITEAVLKAAHRADVKLSVEDWERFNDVLSDYLSDGFTTFGVETKDLHGAVIRCLRVSNLKNVADSYQEYRDYKNSYAKEFEKLKDEAERVMYLGDKENANFDSSLVSTKGSLIKGYLTKALYKQFYLSKKEKELTKRGDIYIHDMRDMALNSFNCCLFDIGNLLKGGFEMSNVRYSEPNSVLSALQVIGDVTLCATAQQFGGFTLAELDKVLVYYCHKSYKHAFDKYVLDCKMNYNEANRLALIDVKHELDQGFQSLELKLNTIPCSRGDFAFTTITFGHIPLEMDAVDKSYMKMIDLTILNTRKNGHNGSMVLFPKLVFLYDKNIIKYSKVASEVFDEAVKCSAKCMYPDFLSLSATQGAVSRVYQEDGCITSPMGCRAYLSPWKDPKTNKHVAIGRCNIGAVSLNLPLIYTVSMVEHRDFFEMLEERLQDIREFLKKRYDIIRHTKASTNPLCFTQGGLYHGYRKPDEEIGDLVDYMTASFGITALEELTRLATGTSLKEDNCMFAKSVVSFIRDKVMEYKKEDGYLYALYGTPAESLCGTQAKQYDTYCKAVGIDNILSTEYFTNSFHLHVSEDVTPFEKQDYENDLFHMVEGGHIQYVRIDNPENLRAVRAVIERGMEHGFYQGVNFDACTCEHCGATFSNPHEMVCPKCGSKDLTVISRTCGYLGYSKIHGESRMNDAKMAEIRDRKSM